MCAPSAAANGKIQNRKLITKSKFRSKIEYQRFKFGATILKYARAIRGQI